MKSAGWVEGEGEAPDPRNKLAFGPSQPRCLSAVAISRDRCWRLPNTTWSMNVRIMHLLWFLAAAIVLAGCADGLPVMPSNASSRVPPSPKTDAKSATVTAAAAERPGADFVLDIPGAATSTIGLAARPADAMPVVRVSGASVSKYGILAILSADGRDVLESIRLTPARRGSLTLWIANARVGDAIVTINGRPVTTFGRHAPLSPALAGQTRLQLARRFGQNAQLYETDCYDVGPDY